ARRNEAAYRVLRATCPEGTRVQVGPVTFGGRAFPVLAGPCAFEGREQLADTAGRVIRLGASVLCGSSYQPRARSYSVDGKSEPGLELLSELSRELWAPVDIEF